MRSLFIFLVSVALLVGCGSTQNLVRDPEPVLNDEGFPGYRDVKVESSEEIFYLGPQAKAFIYNSVAGTKDPIDKMETLTRRIFARSNLNLLYRSSATNTAMETFNSRAANCLSLTIMAYSLAKEAGFKARFQDIQIPEYWERREGYSMLNGHVNLHLFPGSGDGTVYLLNKGLEVDFDPQQIRQHFKKEFVDKTRIVAMFYNNKGADALVSGEFDVAYAYFRAAAKLDPNFDSTFVNLGVLYRFNNMYKDSHAAYSYAIELDSENLTAWENLAYMYRITGNTAEAETIIARLKQKRKSNPYYHFILGEQELEVGNYHAAIDHYQEALALDRSKHSFYFGMAKAYYELGDVTRSQRYIIRARNRTRSDQIKDQYQGKLDLLSARNEL